MNGREGTLQHNSVPVIPLQAGLQFAFYSLLTSLISSLNSSSMPPGSPPGAREERISAREERISTREERISMPQSLSCGGLAGLASKTLLYPLDVVKKRLQVLLG